VIVEFELEGSKGLHKGIFDTEGFWVKYEVDKDMDLSDADTDVIYGYKLYSHFSFAYFHHDKDVVDLVYNRLISVLRGSINVEIEGVGYIRRLNK